MFDSLSLSQFTSVFNNLPKLAFFEFFWFFLKLPVKIMKAMLVLNISSRVMMFWWNAGYPALWPILFKSLVGWKNPPIRNYFHLISPWVLFSAINLKFSGAHKQNINLKSLFLGINTFALCVHVKIWVEFWISRNFSQIQYWLFWF